MSLESCLGLFFSISTESVTRYNFRLPLCKSKAAVLEYALKYLEVMNLQYGQTISMLSVTFFAV